MKECRVCSEIKDLSCFSKHETTKDGYQYICKLCASEQAAQYYTKKSGGRKNVSVYTHQDLSPEERQLLSHLKNLCTKAKHRKWLVTIDMDYLQEVYDKQQGLCRYTGLPLSLESNQTNTISLDRIDSTIGYIQGNVQLVCSMVNRMKQEFSEDEFLKFCILIANRINKDTLT